MRAFEENVTLGPGVWEWPDRWGVDPFAVGYRRRPTLLLSERISTDLERGSTWPPCHGRIGEDSRRSDRDTAGYSECDTPQRRTYFTKPPGSVKINLPTSRGW